MKFQPECPFAQELVPAHHSNFLTHMGERAVSLIVIHITDGHPVARPVAEMWQQPNHGSSAHFVVGQDGSIVQGVLCSDIAWHAHHVNASSIGIEHCARTPHELGPNDPGLRPSMELYRASARLVGWLCDEYHLPRDRNHIVGHAEVDHVTTHVDCPDGAPWDWITYMQLVRAVPSIYDPSVG